MDDWTERGHGEFAGVEVHRVVARPSGGVLARVVIVHGLGEHIGRYVHVARGLSRAGIAVEGFDLPGHGRSPGRRGDVADLDRWVTALGDWVRRSDALGHPVFVYGHSFGGLLALRAAEAGNLDVRGLILSAPWLRLALEPPAWKLAAAALLRRVVPRVSFRTGIDREMLGGDREFLDAGDPDRLAHGWITVRAFDAAVRAGRSALASAPDSRLPLLVWQGDADPVMSAEAAAELVEGCGASDRELRLLPGIRHEPHNDVTRDLVIAGTIEWVLRRA